MAIRELEAIAAAKAAALTLEMRADLGLRSFTSASQKVEDKLIQPRS
jgi:hypothetical protein